jgi:hypothetical protein
VKAAGTSLLLNGADDFCIGRFTALSLILDLRLPALPLSGRDIKNSVVQENYAKG